jgi:hypothetical protein
MNLRPRSILVTRKTLKVLKILIARKAEIALVPDFAFSASSPI